MRRTSFIIRHILIGLAFLSVCLLLNRPEVILVSRLGYVMWYPATGLVLALMLGVNPWYAFVVCLSGIISGKVFYHQPLASFGETIGAAGGASVYAAAAYVLRNPLKIDLQLRRRRDVVLYVSVTTVAAAGATVLGVACLAADHTIRWVECSRSASVWFLGDEIALLGVAPFLLIHILPIIRDLVTTHAPGIASKARYGTRFNALPIIEALSQVIALAAVLWMMFGSTLARYELYFLGFIPIIWIAMRQGIKRVVSGLLALNFGIVVAVHFFPATEDLLSKIGLLMFVVSAVGLLVGSAVSERHRIAIELLKRTGELQEANSQLVNSKDKAEEASRAKSEFLANMSHEIRTPINGILGMAEILLTTNVSQDQRNYLEMLRSSGDSLLGVINDILDFSKIESGRLELCPVEFDLPATIGRSIRVLELSAQSKGLDLTLHIDPEIPRLVVGDAGRVSQVLINLVGNAIKFTPQGAVVVSVQPDVGDESHLGLRFSVADTGIGIPEDKHSIIFEAFAQADGTTTRNFGGSGLGLTISSRLVTLMGGNLWLESSTGRGSTFHFTARFGIAEDKLNSCPQIYGSERQNTLGTITDLDAADRINNHTREIGEEKPQLLEYSMVSSKTFNGHSERTFRKLRILVAEDNPVNQKVIVHMLTKLGHEPTIAKTGNDVLAILKQGSFDLIFMDVQMPEMDGISATCRIRADEHGTGLHIPIVAITAHAMKGDKENCLSAGMDAYLAKPVSGLEIKETLERFLNVPGSPCEERSSASWSPFRALAKLDGDHALLGELVRIFLDESPKQLSKLRQAVETNDFENIERTAHGLKGELRYLGLTEAAQKASGFEQSGREKRLHLPHDSFSNLEADIINVTDCMKQMLEDKRTVN